MDREQIEQARELLGRKGLTLKVDWINGDPAAGFNGVRLTRAKALYARADSIQIFDRETVTLSFGFAGNENHVSLTGEDAREFLRATSDDMPQVLWDAIPEKSDAPAVTRLPVINRAKAELVDYLAHIHPEEFGPGGAVQARGKDFYDAVKQIFQERGFHELTRRFEAANILALETYAHSLYNKANYALKTGDRVLGKSFALAADHLREAADVERNFHKIPENWLAPADWRDAIAFDEIDLPENRPPGDIVGELARGARRPSDVLSAIAFAAGAAGTSGRRGFNPGDLVVISDAGHQFYSRMAEVVNVETTAAHDQRVTVRPTGPDPTPFDLNSCQLIRAQFAPDAERHPE